MVSSQTRDVRPMTASMAREPLVCRTNNTWTLRTTLYNHRFQDAVALQLDSALDPP